MIWWNLALNLCVNAPKAELLHLMVTSSLRVLLRNEIMSGMRQIKFPHYPERLASRCQQNKRKSCSTYYLFSEFFIKTICNILIIGYLAVATAFHLCLPSLLSYSQKSCQGNFKNPTKVGLAVLKKIVIFWIFKNGSINLFGNTSGESWLLIFQIMLPKYVHTGWKFHRTLNSSMFFSLKHFFILV